MQTFQPLLTPIDKMAYCFICKIRFIAKVHVVSLVFKLEMTIGITHAFRHSYKTRPND